MQRDLEIVEEAKQPMSMNPKKFALWLFLVSVVMVFASLTSAYYVRRAEGNWLLFDLPSAFWVTSVVIALSSISMQTAYYAGRKDNMGLLRLSLFITFILGIVFLIGQFLSWVELVGMKVFWVGNPSGSFLYVLSGLHAIHLVSGIIFLLFVLISSLRFKVHSKNMLALEMCTTYWHFLGGLWIYLFVFLILYR